ncbi:unnamed protein product [Lathyrus oleraceus]|uniref:uncharacterized protein LOC127117719 isoform X2 n=1 Tax=Pisum sativum TaxID=3888 RepID=UPI0021D29B30|nr:uncharacterized protein LOC127117719 isoform X2 [Pisum sativum]XP_050903774.1 uncharacterized protein LOC127117720 isoform X2 [Pisum sativum]
MANFPSRLLSINNDESFVAPLNASTQTSENVQRMAHVERLIVELQMSDLRENALHVLSKWTGLFKELAPLLWNSFGTIVILLQEILSIFPNISMENLTAAQSTRVCNVLALFQCVASHSDTKMLFIEAKIPLYLYPFLQTTNKLPQFEHLRLASLGVIGALVKVSTKEVITFLLSSEIIPLCLCNMKIGKEVSKMVATFIIQKVLEDDDGLAYICATVERFFAVARVLDMVLKSIEKQHAPRLLKLIISCYSRLSDNHRAGIALTSCLPNVLTNDTFNNYLREDPTTWRLVEHLYENIGMNHVPLVPGGE